MSIHFWRALFAKVTHLRHAICHTGTSGCIWIHIHRFFLQKRPIFVRLVQRRPILVGLEYISKERYLEASHMCHTDTSGPEPVFQKNLTSCFCRALFATDSFCKINLSWGVTFIWQVYLLLVFQRNFTSCSCRAFFAPETCFEAYTFIWHVYLCLHMCPSSMS